MLYSLFSFDRFRFHFLLQHLLNFLYFCCSFQGVLFVFSLLLCSFSSFSQPLMLRSLSSSFYFHFFHALYHFLQHLLNFLCCFVSLPFAFREFFSIFRLCHVPFLRSVTVVLVLFHFFYALHHPLLHLLNFI